MKRKLTIKSTHKDPVSLEKYKASTRQVLWFEVTWNRNAHENDKQTNKHLLALAKVNFNMVQATLQKDLRDSSR
uniref:Uncharacterized protein n=1 Tax=Salix viminalis TaxID=40686 RepID=A0A6N2KZ68_SALVM